MEGMFILLLVFVKQKLSHSTPLLIILQECLRCWEHNTQPLGDDSSPDYLSSLISCGFLPDLPRPSHPEQNRPHSLAFLHRDPSSPSAFLPPFWTLSIGQIVSHPLGLGSYPLRVFPGVWHFDFVAILMFQVLVTLGCFPSPTTNSLNLWPSTRCPVILLGSDTI